MGQEIIFINFKIIIMIIFSIAGLLILLLLKERSELSGIIKHIHHKREKSLPVILPQTHKGISKYAVLYRQKAVQSIQAFAKTQAWANIRLFLKFALLVMGVRLVIFLVVYAGLSMNESGRLEAGATFFNSIEKIWTNVWDTSHYINIARDWYQNEGEPRLFIVFFPLYPFLIHLVHFLVPNYFYSGFIVSNLALIFTCFYLYKLTRQMFSEKVAAASVKYMLIFPFSFFFGIVYTEGLFLMLSVMTFYYAMRKDWAVASITAMLASLTKIQGLLLILPLVYEYLQASSLKDRLAREGFKATLGYCLKTGSFLLLVPTGIFLYLLINKLVSGDWFKFLEYQRNHWSQTMGFFIDNLRNYLDHFLNETNGSRLALWFPHLASFTLVTILIFYSFKKMRLSFTIYMLAYAILSYSPTWLLSGSRYLSTLFPIYILIAVLATKKETIDKAATFVSTMLLSLFSLAFFTTAWIM